MSNSTLLACHNTRQSEHFEPLASLEAAPIMERVAPDCVRDRDALYAEFTPLVRRLLRQYGDDAEFRKDLAGEIYYCFCSLLDAYDPSRGVPLRPYLVRQMTTSIYTFARQRWRSQRREVGLAMGEGYSDPSPVIDPTPQWDEALQHQNVVSLLPEAIALLPARQRQVVIWRYYDEYSFEQISDQLGIQPATARSLLRHGINNLRKRIGSNASIID